MEEVRLPHQLKLLAADSYMELLQVTPSTAAAKYGDLAIYFMNQLAGLGQQAAKGQPIKRMPVNSKLDFYYSVAFLHQFYFFFQMPKNSSLHTLFLAAVSKGKWIKDLYVSRFTFSIWK